MKNKVLVFVILFFCGSALDCNAQANECRILYPIPVFDSISNTTTVVHRDTIFLENSLKRKLYFINDKVYLNKKIIHTVKNVNWYAEISYIQIGTFTYVYIYPIYKGQVGPYIWELQNGIAIKIMDKPIVKNKIPYADSFEICEIQLNKYFNP